MDFLRVKQPLRSGAKKIDEGKAVEFAVALWHCASETTLKRRSAPRGEKLSVRLALNSSRTPVEQREFES